MLRCPAEDDTELELRASRASRAHPSPGGTPPVPRCVGPRFFFFSTRLVILPSIHPSAHFSNFHPYILPSCRHSILIHLSISIHFSMAPQPTVLVLGGVGFIGRNFVAHLVENDLAAEIRVVDKVLPQTAYLNQRFKNAFTKVEFMQGNLSNAGTLYPCICSAPNRENAC